MDILFELRFTKTDFAHFYQCTPIFLISSLIILSLWVVMVDPQRILVFKQVIPSTVSVSSNSRSMRSYFIRVEQIF